MNRAGDRRVAPDWLNSLAAASIALAFVCAAIALVLLILRPQKMQIMNVVWPVTALYWGPLALWGLWRMGTPPPTQPRGVTRQQEATKPFWQQVAVAVTHCGAGCTLGDIVGEWLVFAFGWSLFGEKVYAQFLVDFPIAFGLGVIFQYFTVAPMRGLGLKDGLTAALKADTISIVAFEIGLFGWMALSAFVLFPGESTATWNHWFQMQIGMIIGFFTSFPANHFLLRTGLKEPM
jgi:hypothetical protein